MLDLEDLQSKSFSSISLLLRIINEHDESSLPKSAYLPSWIECNDGLSTSIISFQFIQYFQLLSILILQRQNYLMLQNADLEDLIIQIFNIISIPRITKEL